MTDTRTGNIVKWTASHMKILNGGTLTLKFDPQYRRWLATLETSRYLLTGSGDDHAQALYHLWDEIERRIES